MSTSSGNGLNTTWNKEMAYRWKLQGSPVRPSPEVTKIFEHYLDQIIATRKGKANVLILGATPEFRDLVLDKGLLATVVDYSSENYEMLSLLMNHADPESSEDFVNANWLKMHLDRTFDFVMADHSLNVINHDSILVLLEKVASYMSGHALFVSRTWIRPERKKIDPRAVIEDYRMKIKQTNVPFYPTCVGPLQHYYYHDQEESIRLSELGVELNKLHDEGMLTDEEWLPVRHLRYEKVTLNLYIPLQEHIVELLSRYWRVQETIYTSDPYCEYCPIYVLEKAS